MSAHIDLDTKIEHTFVPELLWQSWSEETLNRAQNEKRPIFLHIASNSCPWSEATRKESFTDAKIIRTIEEHFIPIHINRTERPDIDLWAQATLRVIGQPQGWPATLFLTPDAKPFWACTYLPPYKRFNRPALTETLEDIIKAWHEKRDQLGQNAQIYAQNVQNQLSGALAENVSRETWLSHAKSIATKIDPENKGLRTTPKFPAFTALETLLHLSEHTQDVQYQNHAIETLYAICKSPLHDTHHGGFYRYATHHNWTLPHKEKTLQDQAFMAEHLTRAHQHTHDILFEKTLEALFIGIEDNFKQEEGPFYISALYTNARTPLTDTTISIDKNAMLCAAYAHAGFIGDKQAWILRAQHLYQKLKAPGMTLYRQHNTRPHSTMEILSDYAHMIRAALILFGITNEKTYLDDAKHWLSHAETRFKREDTPLLCFMAGCEDTPCPNFISLQDTTDGPSAIAIMIESITRLAAITGQSHYMHKAQTWRDACKTHIPQITLMHGAMLNSWHRVENTLHIHLDHGTTPDTAAEMLHIIKACTAPNLVITQEKATAENKRSFHKIADTKIKASVTLCRKGTCQPPIYQAKLLKEKLLHHR